MKAFVPMCLRGSASRGPSFVLTAGHTGPVFVLTNHLPFLFEELLLAARKRLDRFLQLLHRIRRAIARRKLHRDHDQLSSQVTREFDLEPID
jgi:hypothetical protein